MRLRREDFFAGGLIAILLAYAAIRAARLPITIDEAITYRFFVTAPVSQILFPNLANPRSVAETSELAANNHALNSLLAKVSSSLFGTSEITLRLPNVIALAAYGVFSWLILRSFRPGWIGMAGLALMMLNPFLLDYFSMARGYGLSLGLMMPGLYLLARSVRARQGSARDEFLGLFLLGLGALASFVLIDVLFAVAIVLTAMRAIRIFSEQPAGGVVRLRRFAIESLPLLSIGLLLGASVGLSAIGVQRAHGLWYGGHAGFWRDTVSSLVEPTLYTAPYAAFVRPIVTGLIAAAAALLTWRTATVLLHRPISEPDARAAAWTMLLFVAAALGVLEQRFLHVPFRLGRAALFFVPLFVLAVTATATSAAASAKRGPAMAVTGTMAALAIAAGVHFAFCANVNRFLYFTYDLDTPNLLADLERVAALRRRPLRIRTDWHIAPAMEFYRVTRKLGWFTWDTQAADWSGFDFAYVRGEDIREIPAHGFRILKYYGRSGDVLGAPASGALGTSLTTPPGQPAAR